MRGRRVEGAGHLQLGCPVSTLSLHTHQLMGRFAGVVWATGCRSMQWQAYTPTSTIVGTETQCPRYQQA
jgi:hypothetical protein